MGKEGKACGVDWGGNRLRMKKNKKKTLHGASSCFGRTPLSPAGPTEELELARGSEDGQEKRMVEDQQSPSGRSPRRKS